MDYGEWGMRFHERKWVWVEIMVASGHLPEGSLYSHEWRQTHSTDSPKGLQSQLCLVWTSQYPGLSPHEQVQSPVQASASCGQNGASCFQGNVLKWPMKGFLDIASPGKAIFSWLNYKWIRNIWSEFPLGFAKRTLDFILPKTFERWFRVFVEHGLAFPSFLFMLWQFRNRTTIS